MYLASLGTHFTSAMLWTNATNVGVGIVVLYFQHLGASRATPVFPYLGIPYLSISVSLNLLLTLMIVTRLVLHGRNLRTTTRSPVGISGLYKAASTMLIESCALFAMSSLVVVGALVGIVRSESYTGVDIADVSFPILAETQVRAFP